jgi:DNA-binding CsgD family transcriptional regulator
VAAQTQDWAAQIQSDLVLTELHTLTGRYGGHVSPSPSAWAHSGAQWMPVSLATYGWHELQAGHIDEATMMFGRVRPMLATLPVNARWMATVMRTGELAAAFDDSETAELTYRMLLPYRQYFGGQSAAYLGAIPATLSRLATTLDDLGAAVTHGTEAIEMERRVGAQPFVALAELALARALIVRGRSGDRIQASTLIEQSRATARRLNMAPTVAATTKLAAEITGLEIGVAALTPREREIAAFLTAGMPNREIAQKLVVSERTIEAHVHNLLPKLGLKNRTQVAAWAVRSGLGGETT